MVSEELRFINNLAVLIELGRPLLDSMVHMREDCDDPAFKPAYTAMIECIKNGGDFTDVLTDYPQLCSRTSLALLKAARRSSCLSVLMPRLARLVRSKVEGGLDPRQRFFETWALLVESGFTTEEALAELSSEFHHGPLGEVAEGLRAAVVSGKGLLAGAQRYPDAFGAVSRDLLRYGEARDLPNALRAITRLF